LEKFKNLEGKWMGKRLKRVSVTLLVSLLISIIASIPAMAEDGDKTVKVSGDQEITITDFVKDAKVNGDKNLIVVKADASVFFDGYKDYGSQSVTFYPDAKYSNDTLELGSGTEVTFDEKYYVIKKDDDFPGYMQALPDGYDGEYFLAAGNFASLEKMGFYEISYSASPAAAPESILVQVIEGDKTADEPATEPSNDPGNEPGSEPALQPATAVPTASKVIVDGKEVSFEAYNIDGNNYFKLRDLAKAVNGSEKQFEVGFDAEKNAISLESGKAYTSVGGELEVSAAPASQTANPTDSAILLDDEEVALTAYNINGNNYFKLRSIASAFNFGVTWDDKANTVGIDTAIDYSEE
jgi:hypothetical protein